MPMYCYVTDDGEVVERMRPIRLRNRPIKLADGRLARRSFQAEFCGKKQYCGDTAWEPVSMGVPLKYLKQAEKAYGCRFVGRGNCAVPSFKNRREGNKVLTRTGWYNYDAGYSDPAPPGSEIE